MLHADLSELLDEAFSDWGYEDPVYRFYHQSFKVYHVQAMTERIVAALQALAPHRPLNSWFMEIILAGTGKELDKSHNEDWLRHTRPIIEAFFHARHMLTMVCKYA